jgi:hypothetical protein
MSQLRKSSSAASQFPPEIDDFRPALISRRRTLPFFCRFAARVLRWRNWRRRRRRRRIQQSHFSGQVFARLMRVSHDHPQPAVTEQFGDRPNAVGHAGEVFDVCSLESRVKCVLDVLNRLAVRVPKILTKPFPEILTTCR